MKNLAGSILTSVGKCGVLDPTPRPHAEVTSMMESQRANSPQAPTQKLSVRRIGKIRCHNASDPYSAKGRHVDVGGF